MKPAPTLAEVVFVAQWWKNHGGGAIRVTLRTYEGRNIIDARTWFTDPRLRLHGDHIPKLATPLSAAERKAEKLSVLLPPRPNREKRP